MDSLICCFIAFLILWLAWILLHVWWKITVAREVKLFDARENNMWDLSTSAQIQVLQTSGIVPQVYLTLWREALREDNSEIWQVENAIWENHATLDLSTLIETYSLSVVRHPTNTDYLYKLSILLRRSGRNDEADLVNEQAKRCGDLHDDGSITRIP